VPGMYLIAERLRRPMRSMFGKVGFHDGYSAVDFSIHVHDDRCINKTKL